VEVILDQAGQKGTGKWTAQTALDLGVPIPTINAALEARFLSALKSLRVQAAESMSPPAGRLETGTDVLEPLEAALYASKICSYAQGMSLIRAGSEEYGWKIDLAEVCRIWKAGCIIRARLLDEVRVIFLASPRLPNLLLGAGITARLLSREGDWREVVTTARRAGLPVLAMSASLAYFDALRSERLPLNLTQAQRDYFGAHRYQRVDDPGGEMVHTDWAATGPSSEESD